MLKFGIQIKVKRTVLKSNNIHILNLRVLPKYKLKLSDITSCPNLLLVQKEPASLELPPPTKCEI